MANGAHMGGILGAARFARKPRRNVKQLHWNTIPPHQVPQTIFSRGLHRMLDTDLENSSSEIDQMFMNRPTIEQRRMDSQRTAFDLDETADQKANAHRTQLHFLESKRATNFEIMLSKFSVDVGAIANAVIALDAAEKPVLTTENLLALRMNMPKQEELEVALHWAKQAQPKALAPQNHPETASMDPGSHADPRLDAKSDVEELLKSRAERLVYRMATSLEVLAPDSAEQATLHQRLRAKLDAAIAIRQLGHQVEEVQHLIEVVLTACRQVFESDRLASVLSAILAIGNYLNQGTNRGNALGFRLSSVLKLSETRATLDRRTTLLHYLVKFVSRRMPDAALFTSDLSAVAAAARVDLGELDAEIRALRLALALVRKESQDHPSDAVNGFLQRETPKVEQVEQAYARMRRQLERTTTYLGGHPTSVPAPALHTGSVASLAEEHDIPETLFFTLHRFMDMFDRCRAELQRLEATMQQHAKRFARSYVTQVIQQAIGRATQGSSLLATQSSPRRIAPHERKERVYAHQPEEAGKSGVASLVAGVGVSRASG